MAGGVEKRGEAAKKRGGRAGGHGAVKGPGPFAPAAKQPAADEDGEVSRHAGLPHIEDGGDFAHGQFMAREHADEAQARFVGQGLEPGEGCGVAFEHIKIS